EVADHRGAEDSGEQFTDRHVTTDPDAAGGLDEAIHSLLALPAGPALVIGVGTGFAAYGLFCFFRARYADL
ncbi:MAG TPA: DUF1206 domain-containing protein, partial [Microbacterium sp.]|nr:DUF1206 domain-containing protein [Microbacterium sp.]